MTAAPKLFNRLTYAIRLLLVFLWRFRCEKFEYKKKEIKNKNACKC